MHGGGGFSGGGHHGGGFSGHHHSAGPTHQGHHGHHGHHLQDTGDAQGFVWVPFFRRREPSGHSTGLDPRRVTLSLVVVLAVGVVAALLAAH
jgi:hypothetical protein